MGRKLGTTYLVRDRNNVLHAVCMTQDKAVAFKRDHGTPDMKVLEVALHE